MSSKPIEVNGDSGMETNAEQRRSRSQIEAVERASQRVGTWPEWKRSATSYRNSGTPSRSKNGKQPPVQSASADPK